MANDESDTKDKATNEIDSISVNNVDLHGVRVDIEWSAADRQLNIIGVETFEQLQAIMRGETFSAGLQVGIAIGKANVNGVTAPPAQPHVRVASAPSPSTQAAEAPAMSHVKEEAAVVTTHPLHVVEPPASPATITSTHDPEDMTVFMRLTLLGEIVEEVIKRGATDYEAVRAFVHRLKDSETCAVLDRIEKQGSFEDRLKRCCISKNVPGALA